MWITFLHFKIRADKDLLKLLALYQILGRWKQEKLYECLWCFILLKKLSVFVKFTMKMLSSIKWNVAIKQFS